MKETRREFLKSAVALGAAAAPLALQGGSPPEERRYEYHGRSEAYKVPEVLRKGTGLKVSRIETYTRGSNLSFVRIQADDGSEGWGQISTYDADISSGILHRKIARQALGKDPAELDSIVDHAIESNYKWPWSYVCRALSGLDTAVWDLLGKREGKSVCELLGGKPRPIPVYGSSMSRSIKPKAEGERLARLRDRFGFRAFKVRVGKVNGHDEDQWPGRTEELIPAVRKAVGGNVALLVDGNSCYTPPRAIQVGRLLEEHGYCHFEEPCPYWELEWTAEVARALEVPVAGGEQDNDLAQWRRMIDLHAVDIVQPDLLYLGGIVRSLRVAAMASLKNLPCVPHSANLALVTLFTLHFFAAIPNAGAHVEFSIEDSPWTDDLFEPAMKVEDGKVAVPEGPGWGVKINPRWLAQAERQTSQV